MNKVILMGRLVADPEFSMTASGIAKCTFRIAVDRDYNKPGEEKQSDFFRITCWRQTAELVDKYFVKGKPILVEAKIQNNNYTDRDGVKHYQDDIVADRVSFLLSDPTRTGSGNSGSRRYDDYDNDRYDDDRYRRSSSRRNDRYDDDDDYRRDSRRRSDRYDDDDRDRRKTSRYDDDDDYRSRRRDDDADRRGDAQDEERRSASSQPKKDIQLGNDSDDSDLGDFKEIISENDLPF